MYARFFKRFFDIAFSLLMLVASLPVTVPAIILLAIVNRGKVFFVQERPGLNEKIFRLIKFKTMNDRKDKAGNFLPDEKRLTRVGKFIRKTSIDELPQFINVLKGDMSVIGPRPLLVEYLPLYSARQRMRHQVKPGITGWAQVNGRNAISWHEKFELDVWYVENQKFSLDLRIFFMTILKIFKSEGVTSSTSVTMEKFIGNN